VLLPPWVAMTVALGSIPSAFGTPWRSIALNAGALSTALGLASLAVHGLVPSPGAHELLLAGLLGAVAFEIGYLGEGLAYLESRDRGAAAAHLVESKEVTGFELALPTIGAAVVGPFAGQPLLAGLVLAAYQFVTWLGLKVMKSEQVHRSSSQFLRDAFSRFVPATVVDQLTEEQAEISLGGEEREITVLFCDVRNFTAWSEEMQPQQIVAQLNDLMTELNKAIFATDGTLDKYTGDGLMAFWGAPVDQPDHAERACRGALEMLERVAALNTQRESTGRPPLHIGVGVHTGTALVGNLGHVDRMNYTAIGDVVNVTARLEAATKDHGLELIVSGDTYAALAASDSLLAERFMRLGDLPVKGRRERVEAYMLDAAAHLRPSLAA
jgi:class 3 adenylate cyclase